MAFSYQSFYRAALYYGCDYISQAKYMIPCPMSPVMSPNNYLNYVET